MPCRLESLLVGMYVADGPKGGITLLVIEAESVRSETQAAAKSIVGHFSGLVRFYLEMRGEIEVDLAGEQSVAVVRDYLESIAERGGNCDLQGETRIVRSGGSVRNRLAADHPLVFSDNQVETGERPKQTPAKTLSTLRDIERISDNKLPPPYKREFAAIILLTTYARRRFSDPQRTRSFGADEDSAHGALIARATRKRRVQFFLLGNARAKA